jgi:PAS domain S-box-containing protein
VVAANEAAAHLFGWHPAAMPGLAVAKLIPAAATIANLANQYRTEELLFGEGPELPGKRKDGSTFPMQLRFSDIRLGKDTLLLVTIRDLTALKQQEASERELQLVNTVLQYVDVPVFMVDREGRIARHNFAFEDFTGHSTRQILSAPFWELLYPEQQWERERERVTEVLAGTEAGPAESWWNRADSSAAGVRVSMRAIDGGGDGARYVMVVGVPRGEALLDPSPVQPDGQADVEQPDEPSWDEWGIPGPSVAEAVEEDTEPPPVYHLDPAPPEEAEPAPVWPMAQVTPIETPVFRDLDLNGLIRSQKTELASLLGERIRLSTILDLSLDSVLADSGLVSGLLQSLTWIGYRGMTGGGKITIETTCATYDREQARAEGGLRGGSYAILMFRYSCPGCGSGLQSLLFTPFDTNGSANLQMTLPALHGLLRANGGNLVVQKTDDHTAGVKVYLPMARVAAFQT